MAKAIASALFLLFGSSAATPAPPTAPLTIAELSGTWAGTLTHAGETESFALEIEPGADGKVLLRMSVPVAHLDRAALSRVAPQVQGEEVRLGPFAFRYDREAKTLTGAAPKDLVPVYEIPLTLRRVDRFDVPPRPELAAPVAKPAWTFDAGSPVWAGATFAEDTVYAGGQDGQLHALEARTGTEKWSFRAGGPIRTRATLGGGSVYFQADDGNLYALDAATGRERWRVRAVDKPIERLPFDNPKSRYDRFGSDVTVAGGRLYLGTHDGRVLALDPGRGEKAWEFASGDSVLAAPAVEAGRIFFGSFDGNVYALDAATGALAWKRDTRAPVVSTPAVAGDRLVVGNRAYDLLGLDARTGERRWKTDVFGWAWGQPAVTETRVYAGTASQKDYPAGHKGIVVAMERSTGRPVWHYTAQPPAKGAYGFPGSPAVGEGRVFVTGLDGRVYAFEE